MAKKPKPPATAGALGSKSPRKAGGKPFTGKDDPRRHPGFPPGVSGNPAGLPAWKREDMAILAEMTHKEFRALARSMLTEAIGHGPDADLKEIALVHRLRGTGAKKGNTSVQEVIMERVYGRVPIEAKLTHAGSLGGQTPGPELNLKHLDPAEQELVASYLEKADRAAAKALEAATVAAGTDPVVDPPS